MHHHAAGVGCDWLTRHGGPDLGQYLTVRLPAGSTVLQRGRPRRVDGESDDTY